MIKGKELIVTSESRTHAFIRIHDAPFFRELINLPQKTVIAAINGSSRTEIPPFRTRQPRNQAVIAMSAEAFCFPVDSGASAEVKHIAAISNPRSVSDMNTLSGSPETDLELAY